jgi:hypothetical protein
MKYQIEALIASSYHVAVVGTSESAAWKATQLRRSTILFLVGISILIVLLVISPL